MDIASSSSTDPLSYVWASLSGLLKEVPRPDILERVRATTDGREGLCALWNSGLCKQDGQNEAGLLSSRGRSQSWHFQGQTRPSPPRSPSWGPVITAT